MTKSQGRTMLERRVCVVLASFSALTLVGCGSVPSAPVEIGANTYFMAASNAAGAFGDVGTVAQNLMQRAADFCATKGKHLQLVETSLTQPAIGHSLGGASIQFECVETQVPVHLRPDNGVSTETTK
ncbi:MAG: hypothetical protein WCA24_00405 [Thiomonas sp.]